MADHPSRVALPSPARLLALAAPPVAFVAAALGTYRTTADGELLPYSVTVLMLAGLSLVLFGAARSLTLVQHPHWPSWVPWVALGAALLPFAALHAARLLHPVRRGAPYLATGAVFAVTAPDPSWELAFDPGASIEHTSTGLTLSAPAGMRAFVELPAPHAAPWTAPPLSWLLPAAFDTASFVERLEWRAAVERAGTYFVLLETDGLLAQLAPYGLHLTVRSAGAPVGVEVTAPQLGGPAARAWALTWDAGRTSLSADGLVLWDRGNTRPLGRIRFGETRTDELHGGRMRLESVAYRRWWRPRSGAA